MAETMIQKPPKYLVCVDEREEARIGLRLAAAQAAARGGVIDILHIIPPADFQTLSGIAERMEQEQRAEAEKLMRGLSEEVFAQAGITPGQVIRQGAIGEEILAAAMADYDISMLVLGVAENTSGRGKLVSWLASQLGSKLFTPLLLVPGNLTDQQLRTLI